MKKIVMLHDELGTQMQIYLALCDAYKVEIAENVESAMYLLRKTKPEILLLDYNFDQFRSNGKTGVDFIRKVKKKYRALKVMMILNDEDREYEPEIHENGADGILYTPIKNRNLISNVRKLTMAAA
ncbi:MAG: response regulator [bacterium]